MKQRPSDRPLRLSVCVTDGMPKVAGRRLIELALWFAPVSRSRLREAMDLRLAQRTAVEAHVGK